MYQTNTIVTKDIMTKHSHCWLECIAILRKKVQACGAQQGIFDVTFPTTFSLLTIQSFNKYHSNLSIPKSEMGIQQAMTLPADTLYMDSDSSTNDRTCEDKEDIKSGVYI